MADKTGRALGTLSPVIYFEKTNGGITLQGIYHERHLALPPIEIGQGPGLARAIWEKRYRPMGYQWCEADTLSKAQDLQQRLIAQETKILQHQGHVDEERRKHVHKQTASSMRQRMASSSCSAYEREFIRLWLEMTEEKQKQYTQRFSERNMYLQALEFDNNHHMEDRMGK